MTNESAHLGRPAAVDRATFQAELDQLRAREKAHTREGDAIAAARRARAAPIMAYFTERQAGYWSWRAHTSIHSSSVSLRPAERISASSVKYSSRGGPGANRISIRAGAPLSLEKAWIPPCGT
jgi:hypothetical protein